MTIKKIIIIKDFDETYAALEKDGQTFVIDTQYINRMAVCNSTVDFFEPMKMQFMTGLKAISTGSYEECTNAIKILERHEINEESDMHPIICAGVYYLIIIRLSEK